MREHPQNCRSRLAGDDGVTVGAEFKIEIPNQVQKTSKTLVGLYPMHHLIS
jgi:hypothetical protein